MKEIIRSITHSDILQDNIDSKNQQDDEIIVKLDDNTNLNVLKDTEEERVSLPLLQIASSSLKDNNVTSNIIQEENKSIIKPKEETESQVDENSIKMKDNKESINLPKEYKDTTDNKSSSDISKDKNTTMIVIVIVSILLMISIGCYIMSKLISC